VYKKQISNKFAQRKGIQYLFIAYVNSITRSTLDANNKWWNAATKRVYTKQMSCFIKTIQNRVKIEMLHQLISGVQ